MRAATIISLAASGVLGAGALFVARVWLPQTQAAEHPSPQATPAASLVPVVAAKSAIAAGVKLEEGKLTLVHMPREAVPEGAFTSIEQVMGREGGAPVALAAMAPREAVLTTRLSGGGAKPAVAAVIAPGKRAYTVTVSAASGGGGHILPGDRVDVLLSRPVETGGYVGEGARSPGVRADVVIQNARVLAMNFDADFASTEKAEPNTATLEVSLDEAGRLALAAEAGSLSLALRRIGAGEAAAVRSIVVSDLSGRFAGGAPAPAKAAPRPRAASRAAPPARPAAPRLVIVNGDRAGEKGA